MFDYTIRKKQNNHGFYCNDCGMIHSPAAVKNSYAVYMDDTYLHGSQCCNKDFAQNKIEYLNLVGVRVNQIVMS
jgi:hypothetical protein